MKKLILGLTMATLISSVHIDKVQAAKDKTPADYEKSIKEPTANLKDALDADNLKHFYGQVECIWRGLEAMAKEYMKAAEATEKDIKKKYQKGDDCSYTQRYCTFLRLEAEMMKKLATALKAISEGTLDILKSDPRSMKDKKFQNGISEFDKGSSCMQGVATTDSQIIWQLLQKIASTPNEASYHVNLRTSTSTNNLDSLIYKELLKYMTNATVACRQLAATGKRSNNPDVRQLSEALERISLELEATERGTRLGSVGVETMKSYLKNPQMMNNINQKLARALGDYKEPKENKLYNGVRDNGKGYIEDFDKVKLQKVANKNYRDAPQLTRTDPNGRNPYGGDVEDAEERRKLYQEPQDRNGFLGRIENSDRRLKDDDAESRSNRYYNPTKTTGRDDRRDDARQVQPSLPSGKKADASWYDGGNDKHNPYDTADARIKIAKTMGREGYSDRDRYTDEAERRETLKRK